MSFFLSKHSVSLLDVAYVSVAAVVRYGMDFDFVLLCIRFTSFQRDSSSSGDGLIA